VADDSPRVNRLEVRIGEHYVAVGLSGATSEALKLLEPEVWQEYGRAIRYAFREARSAPYPLRHGDG